MGLFNRKNAAAIDLREGRTNLEFGQPTPCPSCGEPGYLDSIDLSSRSLMYQHCPACFTKWETAEEDLIEANS